MIIRKEKSLSITALLAAVLLAALTFVIPASAQAPLPVLVSAYNPTTSDPCQNPTLLKSFKYVAISSATTTQLVGLATGQKVYVCGFSASFTGTAPTAAFWSGDTTTPTNGSFSTGTTGGYIALSTTYYYRISGTNALGETLASTESSEETGSGTNTNTITVTATGFTGATGCNIYRGGTGAELFLAKGVFASGACSYVDTGALTPSGALPGANTASVQLTGVMIPTTGTFVRLGGEGTQFFTFAGGSLSVITTGTSPFFEGYLNYVQK